MCLQTKIIKTSSKKEPHAGGIGSFEEQIKASLKFLKLIPEDKKKILVVGCGEGYEVKWLSEKGFQAIGITNDLFEIKKGKKKYGVDLRFADMHKLPFSKERFDCVFASNILEHSTAPLLALSEWRRVLAKNGWLVLVMPSKEWIKEYYHFSVLTHSQTKDLLYKAGYKLLAGPQKKPEISYGEGDIFYDLGRGWGHYDGYAAEKTVLPKNKFMLGKVKKEEKNPVLMIQFIKAPLKKPYNFIRAWYARNHRD